jgi:hypothetical protein
VEFVDSWEVLVLLVLDCASIRIGISEHEFGALFRDNTLKLAHAGVCNAPRLSKLLLLLLDCFLLLARNFS